MNFDFGVAVNVFFVLVGLIILVGILIRAAKNTIAKEQQAQAVVVNKQYYQQRVIRKQSNPYDEDCYVVTFKVGDKKLSFCVSEFSYHDYKVNQKGMLRYRGTKIIDFK